MSNTFARVCEKFSTLSFSAQHSITLFVEEELANQNTPYHFDDYRRRVIDHLKKVGCKATVARTGIPKTTLYRWRKELCP